MAPWLLCSCVQGISVTLCEESIMFWKVSGIGSEAIGPLWNFVICGIPHRVILSRVISFLHYTSLFFPL